VQQPSVTCMGAINTSAVEPVAVLQSRSQLHKRSCWDPAYVPSKYCGWLCTVVAAVAPAAMAEVLCATHT